MPSRPSRWWRVLSTPLKFEKKPAFQLRMTKVRGCDAAACCSNMALVYDRPYAPPSQRAHIAQHARLEDALRAAILYCKPRMAAYQSGQHQICGPFSKKP